MNLDHLKYSFAIPRNVRSAFTALAANVFAKFFTGYRIQSSRFLVRCGIEDEVPLGIRATVTLEIR
jgi:hypothetical protein